MGNILMYLLLSGVALGFAIKSYKSDMQNEELKNKTQRIINLKDYEIENLRCRSSLDRSINGALREKIKDLQEDE